MEWIRDTLHALRDKVNGCSVMSEVSERGGFGMSNVAQRIRMYYGTEASITIESGRTGWYLCENLYRTWTASREVNFIKSKENTRPLKENTPISKKREKRVEKISKISKIIQFFQKKLCFKKQSFFL